MLDVILTLDYELPGSGRGSPRRLMLEPTARLLRQLERHDARLTIMAEVAEILRFRRHARETGSDDFHHREIEEQLRGALRAGHDVQLHLHPSYFNATLDDGGWCQDYGEYDVASLPPRRADAVVAAGRQYLEELLRPVDAGYACVAFRAANWSMQPSTAIVAALVRHGIAIDSSVFKGGRRAGLVRFDYSEAHSDLVPWRVDPIDVCRAQPDGRLIEVPIACERRRLHRFVSATRVQRVLAGRRHRLPAGGLVLDPGAGGGAHAGRRPRRVLGLLARRHAWKLDLNQCSGRQLVAALERAARRSEAAERTVPLVLIGHSRFYTRLNERTLEPFLRHVAAHPERYRFSTFARSLEAIRTAAA